MPVFQSGRLQQQVRVDGREGKATVEANIIVVNVILKSSILPLG
jgi:hypothetical protein